eukprot:TRINITY_DN3236_c0_g3_i2.p1 TRINITY_DN3236_c0_g3~~TRINITY_DN3236_c0_g3_i2.p1  ORF type:complete len:328 (-),score=4.25 TRINITY_DN3236_c0_g3_i2:374-1357(-)
MLAGQSSAWLECFAVRPAKNCQVRHKHKSSDDCGSIAMLESSSAQSLSMFLSDYQQPLTRKHSQKYTVKCIVRSGIVLAFLLCIWLVWLNFLVRSMPNTSEDLGGKWKLPKNFHELHQLKKALDAYSLEHWPLLLVLYISLYLFMQVFIIPGSVFLNLLAGSFLPFVPALSLVTLLVTFGCTLSFLISRSLLSNTLTYIIPKKLAAFRSNVQNQSDSLLYFLLLLRMIPAFPGWFLNMASSVAEVPLGTFVLSTALGMQPQLMLLVGAGRTLGQLNSWGDLYNVKTIVFLCLCSCLLVFPMLLRRYYPVLRKRIGQKEISGKIQQIV